MIYYAKEKKMKRNYVVKDIPQTKNKRKNEIGGKISPLMELKNTILFLAKFHSKKKWLKKRTNGMLLTKKWFLWKCVEIVIDASNIWRRINAMITERSFSKVVWPIKFQFTFKLVDGIDTMHRILYFHSWPECFLSVWRA